MTHNKPARRFDLRQNGRWSEARLNPEPKGPEGFVAAAREVGAVEF